MPDELEGGTQAATAEPPATGDASPGGWTLDDLEDLFDRKLNDRLNPMWSAVDKRIGGVETLRAPILEALQEVKGLRPLVNKLVAGETMEPAEIEKLELAAENARLKQERDAKAQEPAKAPEPAGDPQEAANRLVAHQYFRGGWQDQAKDLFEDEGQEWGTDDSPSPLRRKVEGLQVKVDAKTGQPKWPEWMREVKKLVKAAADDAVKPAPAVVPTAGNQGAGGGEKDLVGKLGRGEYLEPAQMRQAVAAWNKGIRP